VKNFATYTKRMSQPIERKTARLKKLMNSPKLARIMLRSNQPSQLY